VKQTNLTYTNLHLFYPLYLLRSKTEMMSEITSYQQLLPIMNGHD